jgi:hypothetical protein
VTFSPVTQGVAYAAATIAAFFIAPASERFIYFQFLTRRVAARTRPVGL